MEEIDKHGFTKTEKVLSRIAALLFFLVLGLMIAAIFADTPMKTYLVIAGTAGMVGFLLTFVLFGIHNYRRDFMKKKDSDEEISVDTRKVWNTASEPSRELVREGDIWLQNSRQGTVQSVKRFDGSDWIDTPVEGVFAHTMTIPEPSGGTFVVHVSNPVADEYDLADQVSKRIYGSYPNTKDVGPEK